MINFICNGFKWCTFRIYTYVLNTANYGRPLASVSSTNNPCNSEKEGNFCINESIYITDLRQTFIIFNGLITDTSTNGVFTIRFKCNDILFQTKYDYKQNCRS